MSYRDEDNERPMNMERIGLLLHVFDLVKGHPKLKRIADEAMAELEWNARDPEEEARQTAKDEAIAEAKAQREAEAETAKAEAEAADAEAKRLALNNQFSTPAAFKSTDAKPLMLGERPNA